MRYTLVYKKSAINELLSLSQDIAQRIKSAIDQLVDNPKPAGCKKLKALDDTFRIRVGNYRVVYIIKDSICYITIIKIGHRKDIYR